MPRADDYSRADRLFHHAALSSRAVLETTFDLERTVFGSRARRLPIDRPMFVTGLARAGTSLVTRLLHGSGAFATGTYRNMPFALAPNLWARLGSGRTVTTRERGHGDGLEHDLDTPEAIEEVFWRTLEGDRYILRDRLIQAPPSNDTLQAFQDYMRLVVLRDGRSRYLSKNNNNVLRLQALSRALPAARFVHPFRSPLQQVGSLMQQHVRALAAHAEDPFRRRYMTWLGHHEFGSDLRPMDFTAGDRATPELHTADDWLRLWIDVYRHILASLGDASLLLDYDALAAEPGSHLEALAAFAGVSPGSLDNVVITVPGCHTV
ncbi:MAG TPA: sulfotransferase, partial [Sphingomicrobium sp.]